MHNATKLRAALKKPGALKVVGAHDALSARLIERAGFDGVWASGFAISASLKCIPDASFITSSEQLEVERNIAEAVSIPVIADCDTGYGNALNVMRTVSELEHAGVSILGIEDTLQPARFGHGGATELVTIGEMTGKLRAALAARQDPELVIAARIASARVEGVEGTVARAKAYAQTGVDALVVVEVDDIGIIRGVSAATKLPLIVGSGAMTSMRHELEPLRARILLQGHQPVAAAVKALRGVYEHLHRGGAPDELKPVIASPAELDVLTRADEYARAQRDYLR